MGVDCRLGETDFKAAHHKFPLNLCDHHIGGAVVLLLLLPLLPLNRDEGGGACVGLVVNGLLFFPVLVLDLLLVRCFSRLPHQRGEEDTDE